MPSGVQLKAGWVAVPASSQLKLAQDTEFSSKSSALETSPLCLYCVAEILGLFDNDNQLVLLR